MKVSAIISEFNPFHSGHKYLIDETVKNGATHICSVMSGNFVQRGECAIISKWDRAEIALNNGVDLVLEIPTVYAVSSAQRFARGAVGIINALCCIDEIAFGSECGDVNELSKVVDALCSEKLHEIIAGNLSEGDSYASAQGKAMESVFGIEFKNILSEPNNILALEYISEAKKTNRLDSFFTVKRIGNGHNSNDNHYGVPNASMLRRLLKNGRASSDLLFENYRKNYEIFDFNRLELPILSRLRSMDSKDFLSYTDISEGLENRIYESIKKSVSLEELYKNIKTKRYTHARIRRIVLNSFLDIKKDDISFPPPYIKVLGFNEKGMEILKMARTTSEIPIIMKHSDNEKLDNYGKRVYEIECRCSDLFALAGEKIHPCGIEQTKNLVIKK